MFVSISEKKKKKYTHDTSKLWYTAIHIKELKPCPENLCSEFFTKKSIKVIYQENAYLVQAV